MIWVLFTVLYLFVGTGVAGYIQKPHTEKIDLVFATFLWPVVLVVVLVGNFIILMIDVIIWFSHKFQRLGWK